MARPSIATKARLQACLDLDMSTAEIAQDLGLSVRGIQKALKREGLKEGLLSHILAIPWRLAKHHLHTAEAQYLRTLSAMSQDKQSSPDSWRSATNWAKYSVVEKGLDIRYDRVKGWIYFPADPENWHVKNVLTGAEDGLKRMIQKQQGTT